MPKVKVRVKNKKGERSTFHRAGVKFHPDWLEHDLTDVQLKAVRAEPMLEVEEAKAPGRKKGGK